MKKTIIIKFKDGDITMLSTDFFKLEGNSLKINLDDYIVKDIDRVVVFECGRQIMLYEELWKLATGEK